MHVIVVSLCPSQVRLAARNFSSSSRLLLLLRLNLRSLPVVVFRHAKLLSTCSTSLWGPPKKNSREVIFSYFSLYSPSFLHCAVSCVCLSLSVSVCFRLCLTAVFFVFIQFCRRNSFVSFLPFWFATNRKNLGIAAGSNGLSLVSVAICGVFAVFGEKVSSCSPFYFFPTTQFVFRIASRLFVSGTIKCPRLVGRFWCGFSKFNPPPPLPPSRSW